jgi:hypothetical protein
MAANMPACTELKYNNFLYISNLCVKSCVLDVPDFNGEYKKVSQYEFTLSHMVSNTAD